MIRVPEQFTFPIEDACLARLVKKVYRRLPPEDRHVLRERVLEIGEGLPDREEHVLGHAGYISPSLPVRGCIAQIVEGGFTEISLRKPAKDEPEAATLFVIAHEFAHIVLRHNDMGLLVAALSPFEPPIYPDADVESQATWHEEEADLQAWLWGFKDEYRAFLDTYPEAQRARWYVDLEIEGPGCPEESKAA